MQVKRKYHYFYKITNNINGHFYYGVHNTDNLDDGYMGSGKRLHFAYKKYGMENFTKEILKFFNSSAEAFEYEAKVVNETLAEDPNCYNISVGGNGNIGFITFNKVVVKTLSGEIKLVDKNDKKYLSGEYVGITKDTISVKDKYGNYFRVNKNDKRFLNGEFVGITKNTVTVKDKYGNFFNVSKDDPKYLSGEYTYPFEGRKHKQETKDKVKDTFKTINHQQGEKNSQYGTCWIHNNQENKKIKKVELQQWLDDGWIKGRKMTF